jgi:hypothetical protein
MKHPMESIVKDNIRYGGVRKTEILKEERKAKIRHMMRLIKISSVFAATGFVSMTQVTV